MSEEIVADDSSHYEISLTAGQAFVGFVLLLFSLAASFMFGVMIGKGQASDRLVVTREPAVISEASTVQKTNDSRIVELGVPQSDSQESIAVEESPVETPVVVEEPLASTEATVANESEAAPASEAPPAAAPPAAMPREEAKPAAAAPAETATREDRKTPAVREAAPQPAKKVAPPSTPAYAQLLSTGEARTAETLAAKLIDAGFTSAYVERSRGESGMVYRVRVKFASETEARAAADRLRAISKTEPWITRQ